MRIKGIGTLRYIVITGLSLWLAGCGSVGGIFEPADGAPPMPLNPQTINDAIPRKDPVTRAGNKNPYTVRGKTYSLLPSAAGYTAEGTASWYGTKFHGRPTANGERYSLYGMTAAHKTLPIPAYVRVTNLNNGRTAVVRVNDRGPFHGDRLIDLSYAAAVKLGFAKHGTAPVRIEVIEPAPDHSTRFAAATPPPKPPQQSVRSREPQPSAPVETGVEDELYYLQVAAFKSLELANRLRAELVLTTNQSVKIAAGEAEEYYRVQVGPLDHMSKVQALSELLIEAGHGKPRLLRP